MHVYFYLWAHLPLLLVTSAICRLSHIYTSVYTRSECRTFKKPIYSLTTTFHWEISGPNVRLSTLCTITEPLWRLGEVQYALHRPSRQCSLCLSHIVLSPPPPGQQNPTCHWLKSCSCHHSISMFLRIRQSISLWIVVLRDSCAVIVFAEVNWFIGGQTILVWAQLSANILESWPSSNGVPWKGVVVIILPILSSFISWSLFLLQLSDHLSSNKYFLTCKERLYYARFAGISGYKLFYDVKRETCGYVYSEKNKLVSIKLVVHIDTSGLIPMVRLGSWSLPASYHKICLESKLLSLLGLGRHVLEHHSTLTSTKGETWSLWLGTQWRPGGSHEQRTALASFPHFGLLADFRTSTRTREEIDLSGYWLGNRDVISRINMLYFIRVSSTVSAVENAMLNPHVSVDTMCGVVSSRVHSRGQI